MKSLSLPNNFNNVKTLKQFTPIHVPHCHLLSVFIHFNLLILETPQKVSFWTLSLFLSLFLSLSLSYTHTHTFIHVQTHTHNLTWLPVLLFFISPSFPYFRLTLSFCMNRWKVHFDFFEITFRLVLIFEHIPFKKSLFMLRSHLSILFFCCSSKGNVFSFLTAFKIFLVLEVQPFY